MDAVDVAKVALANRKVVAVVVRDSLIGPTLIKLLPPPFTPAVPKASCVNPPVVALGMVVALLFNPLAITVIFVAAGTMDTACPQMCQSPALRPKETMLVVTPVDSGIADPRGKLALEYSPTFPALAESLVTEPGICPTSAVPTALGCVVLLPVGSAASADPNGHIAKAKSADRRNGFMSTALFMSHNLSD